MAYSQADLQQLWVQAGGPAAVAALMAAIGLAESGGDPGAVNASSGACGLWQIHPAEAGCQDPFSNAQMAVRKYNDQGLRAWEAYTNGAYRKYAQDGGTGGAAPAAATGPCIYGIPLFGTSVCADGIVGAGVALLGLGLIALGIMSLVREL